MPTSFSNGSPGITITDGTAAAQIGLAYYIPFLQRLYLLAPDTAIAYRMATSGVTTQGLRYAGQILGSPKFLVDNSIVYALIADGTITANSTDQAICNKLGDLWPMLSTNF